MRQIGPYLYDRPQDIFHLRFPTEDGAPRIFTVIKSSAYNAGGLIGSEYNGIVVLDNGTQENSGMLTVVSRLFCGDNFKQQTCFDLLKEASWKEFTQFVKDAVKEPGARGGWVPEDVDQETPDPGNLMNLLAMGLIELRAPGETDITDPAEALKHGILLQDQVANDIRTPDMIAANESDSSYKDMFPPISREMAILQIMRHDFHTQRYEDAYLSWNVKLDFGVNPEAADGPNEVNEAYDDRWKEYLKENESQVWEECRENMARTYLEGEYTTYPGNDQGDYEFRLRGRSGGQLILTSVDGEDLGFESMSDIPSKLADFSDKEIAKIYYVMKTLDHDISRPKLEQEFNYQLNFIRTSKEDEWDFEAAPSV